MTFEATAGALSNGTTLVRGVISNDQSTGAPTVKSSYTNGVVIFAGANTYTNATTIEVGASLQLGAGGTTGSLHPASKITNSGTLAFSRADTVRQGADFYGLLNGTGGVSQEGPGTVVFTATNTYTRTPLRTRHTAREATYHAAVAPPPIPVAARSFARWIHRWCE